MKIYQALGIAAANSLKGPYLGIECETEGKRLPVVAGRYWRTEEDGSLRNGLEYVSQPLKPVEVKAAVASLQEQITSAGGKTEYSFRCSTHVHVNVQDLTDQQLICMIFLYMMYENVFMNYVADVRIGNRFCLRFQDAQYLTAEVGEFISNNNRVSLSHAMAGLRQDRLKYAALNLYTLNKYGTLEFRALEGCGSPERITKWIQALVRLRSTAMKWNNPAKLYEAFIEDPTELAMLLFGHAPEEFMKPGWQQQVEEGYSQNQAVLMYL